MLWNFCLPHSYWKNFSLKHSLSLPGQKGEEKDGAQNNFLFPQDKVNFEMHLHADRAMYPFLKIKRGRKMAFQPKQSAALLLTLIKNNNVWIMCSRLHPSCVLQEMSSVAARHNERSPLCWGGRLWMQSGGCGRTIFHSAALAAVSGSTHYAASDLLCNNTESRAVGFGLDKCVALLPVSTIQDQIEGATFIYPSTIKLNAEHFPRYPRECLSAATYLFN